MYFSIITDRYEISQTEFKPLLKRTKKVKFDPNPILINENEKIVFKEEITNIKNVLLFLRAIFGNFLKIEYLIILCLFIIAFLFKNVNIPFKDYIWNNFKDLFQIATKV
jgi:hypothetical protein